MVDRDIWDYITQAIEYWQERKNSIIGPPGQDVDSKLLDDKSLLVACAYIDAYSTMKNLIFAGVEPDKINDTLDAYQIWNPETDLPT